MANLALRPPISLNPSLEKREVPCINRVKVQCTDFGKTPCVVVVIFSAEAYHQPATREQMLSAWRDVVVSARLADMDLVAPPITPPPALALTSADEQDSALMRRYQAGDAGAFDLLYERHRAPLYRFIQRQMDARSETDEVFQEVWMNVIQAREVYEPHAKFRTWLYTLAHRRVMDFFRKHRYVTWVDFDGARDDEADEHAGSAPADTIAAPRQDEPEIAAISQEQAKAILKLVEALPAPQREAFLLSEEGGLTVPEIAAATGVSLEAAKSRLRYALAKLREGLKEYR